MAAESTTNSTDNYQHFYPQVWLLVMSVATFGIYVAFEQGLLNKIIAVDRSYLSTVVALILIAMTIHALWHVIRFSRRIHLAEALVRQGPNSVIWKQSITTMNTDLDGDESIPTRTEFVDTPERYLSRYLSELKLSNIINERANATEPVSVLEIYADRLRSPVELGWYVVDLAIRMGLIGTIIGFILIFSSLTGDSIPGIDEMQSLLISMSTGMGTALYTTLCGLVCATVLGMQYMILGRETEYLIALLIRLRNRSIRAA